MDALKSSKILCKEELNDAFKKRKFAQDALKQRPIQENDIAVIQEDEKTMLRELGQETVEAEQEIIKAQQEIAKIEEQTENAKQGLDKCMSQQDLKIREYLKNNQEAEHYSLVLMVILIFYVT